ncbi:MAG: EFR1 family ferrodoxin [Clostridia bacterium]|nr:EFR1 family ferrodoxin [Clostridia bacterium]
MKIGLIFYFSGTGNTRHACQYIKKHMTNAVLDLYDITQGELPDLNPYDFFGFASPADWFDPPLVVKTFIEKLPQQNDKSAFLVNTCAGFSGKSLKTLKSWVNDQGFKVVGGFTLKAPESYPPYVAKGVTKEKNPVPKNISQFNNFISNLNKLFFQNATEPQEGILKIGLIDYLLPRYPRNKSKIEMGKKYIDDTKCNKCGLCQSVCPYKSVTLNEKPDFNEEKCNGCWVCYNHCKQKAIYTDKIRDKGHYQGLEKYKQKLKL